MKTNIRNSNTLAIAIAVALALASTAAMAAPQKTQIVTGSLIPQPLRTVVVRTPDMSAIRAIAIRPIVRPIANGRCEIIGAVYSDNAALADGPMPGVRTALIGPHGQRMTVTTNRIGVYHAIVGHGTWREARPVVGELPFGVHPSRPRIKCE